MRTPERIHPVRRIAASLAAAALLSTVPLAGHARIDLVTLPQRDATEITVYNSQDLTLVRETRTLPFSEGDNQIQFSWANTLIDPTSLRLELPPAAGMHVVDAVYPAGTDDLIVWNIESEEEATATVVISYFISGLTWKARYHARVNGDESALLLRQYTTVENQSGEDFEATNVRTVVGEVNLVELIENLARRGVIAPEEARKLGMEVMRARERDDAFAGLAWAADAAAPSAGRAEAREIIQRAVSEYKLYTVDGEVDIQNGWAQRLPSKPLDDVPFEVTYELDNRRHGPQPVKVYLLRNNTDHELGSDALPEGEWYVTADDGRGGLRYEGTTRHDYIPVGDDIELNLGPDGLVLFEERLADVVRGDFDYDNERNLAGWLETRTYELEVSNGRGQDVPMKITWAKEGDWQPGSASHDFDTIDRETLRWEFDLPAGESTTITVDLVHRHGSLRSNPPPPIRPLGGRTR